LLLHLPVTKSEVFDQSEVFGGVSFCSTALIASGIGMRSVLDNRMGPALPSAVPQCFSHLQNLAANILPVATIYNQPIPVRIFLTAIIMVIDDLGTLLRANGT